MNAIESKPTGKDVSFRRTPIRRGASVPRLGADTATEDLVEDPDDLHKTEEELREPVNYDFMIDILTRAEEMTIGLKSILGRRPTKNELWYALRSARHVAPSNDVPDAHPKDQTLAQIDTFVKGYRRTHAQKLQEYSRLSKYPSRIQAEGKDSSSPNIPPSDTITPPKEPAASAANERQKKVVPKQRTPLSEQQPSEKKAPQINPSTPATPVAPTTPAERIVPQHKKRKVTLMADAIKVRQAKLHAETSPEPVPTPSVPIPPVKQVVTQRPLPDVPPPSHALRPISEPPPKSAATSPAPTTTPVEQVVQPQPTPDTLPSPPPENSVPKYRKLRNVRELCVAYDPAMANLPPEDRSKQTAQLTKQLSKLPEREERVLQLRYGLLDGRRHVYREIGKDIGVSPANAHGIEIRALRHLHRAQQMPSDFPGRMQVHLNETRLCEALGISSQNILLTERNRIYNRLANLSPKLNKKDIVVATMRSGLFDGKVHSLKEVGRKLNVSAGRICQRENKVIQALQSPSPQSRQSHTRKITLMSEAIEKPQKKLRANVSVKTVEPAPSKSRAKARAKQESSKLSTNRRESKHDDLYKILGPWTNALDPKQRTQLNGEIRKMYSSILTPRETQIMKDIDPLKDDASAISKVAQQRKISERSVRDLRRRAIVKMHRALIRNGDFFRFIDKYNRSSEAT